ncbi:putative serine/threonine-protein kinase iks1, partial [Coemansia nantahalensis]
RALRVNAGSHLPAPGLRDTRLIPYSPWQVILYRQPAGQAVLYNADSSDIEVARVPSQALVPVALQPPAPSRQVAARPERTRSLEAQPYACPVCPTCRQLLPARAASGWDSQLEQDRDGGSPTRVFTDREYFKRLARSLHPPRPSLALSDSRDDNVEDNDSVRDDMSDLAQLVPSPDDESTGGPAPASAVPASQGLSEGSFNQGYYERFFLEQKKLGKGLRGSVFSCQHILDSVYLGHYAVKKVAVGNNHQWLQRMLREVKLLESLRHPNVVEYKHSWLETHQLTAFGPKVPCLFILMEYANGGNLQ